MVDTEKSEPKKKGISTDALDKVAYVATAVVAVGMADNSIKDACYQKYKEGKEMPELRSVRSWRHVEREKIISAGEPKGQFKGIKRAWQLQKVENEFAGKVKSEFKKAGLYNDLDYFITLDSTAKGRVFEKVATVSGIVLATSLALANIDGLTKRFSRSQHEK